MVTILQGSNDPLILEVEGLDNAVKISAELSAYGNVKKSWDDDDISTQDNTILLPLTESETMALPRGVYILDIKALDSDDHVIFMDLVKYRVADRPNTNMLLNEG